jgi:hypothetical protein
LIVNSNHHIIVVCTIEDWDKILYMSLCSYQTLIKATLAAIHVHIALIVELPGWVRKALIKITRAFLWSGTDLVQGGKCTVVWSQVQKPLHLGGLGVPDLKLTGLSL